MFAENGAKVIHHQPAVYQGGKCYLSELIQWFDSADSVAKVGREPVDYDLISVLVPGKINPHAEEVLVDSSSDNVELQERTLSSPEGVIHVVIFTPLPGADCVDLTREIHPVSGKSLPESLVRPDAHPGIPVFVGEDQQGPVNHPDLGVFGL